MKQKLQITGMLVLLLCTGTIYAQRDTIAYWGFNASTAEYLYWAEDEENGLVRAYALNECKDKKDATFGAYREGVREGEPLAFYENHTMSTTTILGTNCIAQQAWQRDDEMGRSNRYWLLDNISTIDMENIEVTIYLTCAGTGGPGKAKFGYRIGEGSWVDDPDFKDIRGNVLSTGNFVGSNPADLWKHVLPSACNNQPKVSFRWLVNDVRVDGVTAISASSFSRVDDVAVTGVKSTSGIPNVSLSFDVEVEGELLFAGEEVSVVIYNQVGAIVTNRALSPGASIVLPKGLNIIKLSRDNRSEVLKRIVL